MATPDIRQKSWAIFLQLLGSRPEGDSTRESQVETSGQETPSQTQSVATTEPELAPGTPEDDLPF